jgi:hypothetical protein
LQNSFRIGESHHVEPSLNSVTGPTGTTRLEPMVMQVLLCLAGHADQVVTKEGPMRAVWPDTFVGDDVLPRAFSELRRVFGDDVKDPRFIQMIPERRLTVDCGGFLQRGTRPCHARTRRQGVAVRNLAGRRRARLPTPPGIVPLLFDWTRPGTRFDARHRRPDVATPSRAADCDSAATVFLTLCLRTLERAAQNVARLSESSPRASDRILPGAGWRASSGRRTRR